MPADPELLAAIRQIVREEVRAVVRDELDKRGMRPLVANDEVELEAVRLFARALKRRGNAR